MDITARREKTDQVDALIDGERVTMEVYVHRLDSELQEIIARATDERRSVTERQSAILDVFCSLVKSWDITAGGKPWPPTRENVALLDADALGTLFGAVIERLFPKSATSTTSSATSAA